MAHPAKLDGRRYGSLLVVERDGYHIGPTYKRILWKCKCDCGNTTRVSTGDLKRSDGKGARSCGCKRATSGQDSPTWKGVGELSSSHWSRIQSNARRKGREGDLTREFIWELFLEQNRLCALSGIPLEMEKDASLDRIDSNLPYTRDNVQWVHKDINRMKTDFSQDHFIYLCQRVAENNG